MQAQPGQRCIMRSFIDHGQAQACQRRQVAAPLRLGKASEGGIRMAQRRVLERMGLGRALLGAARAKEVRHQGRAFPGQHAARHLRVVVDLRQRKHVQHRSGRARARLGRAIDHAAQARMQHGAAAHGARLQGHIERAIVQPVVAQARGRVAQRQHLGMGRGVALGDGRIAALADDGAVLDDDGAHGHLARLGGGTRQFQGGAHPGLVVGLRQWTVLGSQGVTVSGRQGVRAAACARPAHSGRA